MLNIHSNLKVNKKNLFMKVQRESLWKNKIKSSDVIFAGEYRIILFSKVKPKINIIRLIYKDKANIHSFKVNKMRIFLRPKFEIELMVVGGISKEFFI